MQIYLLDTGALLSQWTLKSPQLSFVTTQSVIDEVQNKPSMNRVQNLISTDRLQIGLPTPEALEAAKKQSSRMGDAQVLSPVDLELIAVGIEYVKHGHQVHIVSTDLAVLNTAASLGFDIVDPKGRMKQKIVWVLRCPACGYKEPKGTASIECPNCGTEMRRTSKKKKKLG